MHVGDRLIVMGTENGILLLIMIHVALSSEALVVGGIITIWGL